MKRLQDYFSSYVTLPAKVINFLTQNGKIKHYKKEEYYIRENDIKHSSTFLLKGLLS